jgi:hypothetical protein
MENEASERAAIAKRVRQIRVELLGKGGAPFLAEALGLPSKTWEMYEAGAVIPEEVMLEFIEITKANLDWLLTGEGGRYQLPPPEPSADPRW